MVKTKPRNRPTQAPTTPTRSTESRRSWVAIAALIVLPTVCYLNSLTAPFIFDGRAFIAENIHLRTLLPLWKPEAVTNNRPVPFWTFALNHAVHGNNVFGFHVTNVAIHVAAGLALFGVARRTLQLPGLEPRYGAKARELAAAIALLWACHPLQTQSVTYLYQRLESLMGLFFLLAMYCFVRGATAQEAAAGAPSRRNIIWFAGATLSAALAMGTKEVALGLPLMALWWDRAFLARSWPNLWRRRGVVHLALAATWIVLAGLMISQSELYGKSGIGRGGAAVRWTYLLNQGPVILRYLRLAVWPTGLCLDYSWKAMQDAVVLYGCVAVVGALVLATIVAVFRRPHWGFLGGWFFVILAPSSSFVPIVDLIFEHRMYLSLASLTAAAVIGAYRLASALTERGRVSATAARKTLTVALAASVALLIGLTWRRNYDYRSEDSIWFDVLSKRPPASQGRAYWSLGSNALREKKYDQAIEYLDQALKTEDYRAGVWHARGVALAELQRYEAAGADLLRARELDADDPSHTFDYALMVLERTGRRDEALRLYDEILASKPSNFSVLNERGRLLWQLGRPADAVSDLERALTINPEHFNARMNLGLALYDLERFAEAASAFDQAAQIQPDDPRIARRQALVHAQLGQMAALRTAFDRARRLHSPWPELSLEVASILLSDHAQAAAEIAEIGCHDANWREPRLVRTLIAALERSGNEARAAGLRQRFSVTGPAE